MDATIEVVLKQMVLFYEKLFFFSIALFFVGLVVLLVKNKKRFISCYNTLRTYSLL